MCFTPWISLTTAIVEFVVASFILVRYKNYLVPVFSAIFIYALGFYQFTEFMLCISGNSGVWSMLGFMTYTFLPAIGLHMAFRFVGKKFWSWIFYLFPLGAIAFVLLAKGFILETSCSKVFVVTRSSLFYEQFFLFSLFYWIYYFGFIIAMICVFASHIKENEYSKIYYYWIVSVIFTILAPIFLIVIFPALISQFPSIYCEFALGFTIVALVGSRLYSSKRKKEKF